MSGAVTNQTKTTVDRRLQSLAVFVELERRIRQAENEQTLGFLLVNEIHSLSAYRQAVLWQSGNTGNGALIAVSGLANPEADAPYSAWIRRVAATLNVGAGQPAMPSATCSASPSVSPPATPSGPRAVTPDDLPPILAEEWSHWLPQFALWVPLRSARGAFHGGLLLARDNAWSDAECKLLGYLAETAMHAWDALVLGQQRRLLTRFLPQGASKRKLWLGGIAAVLLLGLFPVRQTTLAPAEIIARDPVLIRAPVEGVVDRVEVSPNQEVVADQVLLSLDASRLANRLEVAQQALEVADAEYRQAAQQGLFDSRANAEVTILQGRAEQHEAEVKYLQEMLERIVIRAPRSGIVIFDSVNDWLGRPVAIGERIMMLADPAATELELRVPVADAIALNEGARVRVFLNTDPHRPVDATLRFASYQAALTPEGILAYRLVATFPEDTRALRIGLKGTAKLYGDRTVLALYLLRRPLTSLRQVLGI